MSGTIESEEGSQCAPDPGLPQRVDALESSLRARLLPQIRRMVAQLRSEGADDATIKAMLEQDSIDAAMNLKLDSKLHAVAVAVWLRGVVEEAMEAAP